MTECSIQILPALLLRHQFAIGVMNDTIFACGGHTANETFLDSCEQFTASAGGAGGGRWSMISARLPFPVAGQAMAISGGKLYLVGGDKASFHTGTLDTDTMSSHSLHVHALVVHCSGGRFCNDLLGKVIFQAPMAV